MTKCKWNLKDPDERREYMREWGKKNRHLQSASAKRYRSRPEIKAHLAAKKRTKNATPEGKRQAKARVLKYHFGMSLAEYDARVIAQCNQCAICGKDGTTEQYEKLNVDHDHKTGAVRDLLCSGCNHGLGHFKDNPEFLAVAIAYLEKHRG